MCPQGVIISSLKNSLELFQKFYQIILLEFLKISLKVFHLNVIKSILLELSSYMKLFNFRYKFKIHKSEGY